jgi:hypothetical protein
VHDRLDLEETADVTELRGFEGVVALWEEYARHTLSAERLTEFAARAEASELAEYTEPVLLRAARMAMVHCSRSRVTARRYLEHLADAGVAGRSLRHGGSGRPEVEYVGRRDPEGPVVTRPR